MSIVSCRSVPPATLSAHDWIAENLKQIRVDDPDHFSFAVFGDNRGSREIFPGLLKQISRDPEIRFAMDLGDLVPYGTVGKYRDFMTQIQENLNRPLLTAIGNHELLPDGRGLYHDLFGPFYYSFTIGNSHFIVLDDANEKGLDRQQEKWLENELKKARDDDNRFVFMHVPLFDPRGGLYRHGLTEKAGSSLSRLFSKYRVTHIFASHIHGYFSGRWGDTPFTITGGGGAGLFGRDHRHYFYHYVKVTVDKKRVDINVRRGATENHR